MSSNQCCEVLASLLCEYKSVRFIRVRNVKLSILYWIIMFFVLLYVVLGTVWYEKGYQDTDTASGTTSAKIKGSASIGDVNGPLQDLIPFDAMDLVQPSMEENSFFLITARTITPNQTRQIDCPGNDDVPTCSSTDTLNCTQQLYDADSQGLYTGICGNNGRCEMYSWCPLENDTNYDVFNGIGAFTVFVKVDINFEQFGVSRTNIYEQSPGNRAPELGYNLFVVDEMLGNATNGAVTNVSQIAGTGAILLVSSIWNCDLDKGEDECNPEWSFSRIDGKKNTISRGFNFRTVSYDTSETTRYLRKYYGIRTIFIVEGEARKFSVFALTVTFGAGLAYIGIAAVITDFVLERFLPESSQYFEQKHKILHSADTERNPTNDGDGARYQKLHDYE
mmetsp:Transcript_38665/g.61717  ORF Transcript_38665/g.61717 Transcript_38665/m.61717 type:complete len:392 (+) Transcript_38665:19-1194(+)